MEPGPAYAAWFEILWPSLAVALILAFSVLIVRTVAPQSRLGAFRWLRVSWIATVQFLLFMAAFWVSFGYGVNGSPVPWPIGAAALLLAFPLVYALYLGSILHLSRDWLGDGVAILAILAALNAAVWGIVLTWLPSGWRRHADH